ncbi:MAG: histone deacetylase [Anaerolineales bacterium]
MDKLVYFYNQGHEKHYETGHPERPERVEVIKAALEENDFWEKYPKLPVQDLPEKILTTIHTREYLRVLEEACRLGSHLDADTYTTSASWKLALGAAGGAAAVANSVWSREAERGFALTRPPGHHATAGRGMGFCLLNNVALAAEYLVQELGANRLAIVDLDLHHGNGTQDIFYSRGDVLYISTHQYPHYPGSGWIDETGKGAGQMANANLPLPPYSGDAAFKKGMDEFILPLLDGFQPEMLLISYGFDPHFDDPLGSLQLTSQGYGDLILQLTDWADRCCNGRISLFLEGGYNLRAAQACSLAVVAALLGDKFPERYDQDVTQGLEGNSDVFNSILQQDRQLWGIG